MDSNEGIKLTKIISLVITEIKVLILNIGGKFSRRALSYKYQLILS